MNVNQSFMFFFFHANAFEIGFDEREVRSFFFGFYRISPPPSSSSSPLPPGPELVAAFEKNIGGKTDADNSGIFCFGRTVNWFRMD